MLDHRYGTLAIGTVSILRLLLNETEYDSGPFGPPLPVLLQDVSCSWNDELKK